MGTWYDESLFLLHLDFPIPRAEHPPPSLAAPDPEEAARLLGEIRPDAVQVTAKGASGLTLYPTAYGNAAPSLPEGLDLLRPWREAARELGIRFVAGYGGLIDAQAGEMRPDWLRIGANRSPYPSRALCPNAGYVDELMLPQLLEIMGAYAPDGIWIDGESWTVSPCYCPACETGYQDRAWRSAPLDPGDGSWGDWLAFHRESFGRYLERIARELTEREPELVVTSSGACGTHQPEPVPWGTRRLCRELPPAFALRTAGLEARFLSRRGVPFDLMTWTDCSARPWPQGKLPALPLYPKSFDHLAQEGAAALAHGGRWTAWLRVPAGEAAPSAQRETVARAAAFARERAPWCRGTDSAAYVAVLHSERTHRRTGNGLYDHGPSLDRIRGAHQALLELHHPHDIVTDEMLLADLDRYWVVVIPEQVEISPDLDGPLTEWVRAGGRLIASGKVSPRIIEDIPTFALEEALGVRWTGRQASGGWIEHRGRPLRIAAPVYDVANHSAETIHPFLRSGDESRPEYTGHPAVTRNQVGEGEALYIAADLFTAYYRHQYPGLRDLFGEILGGTMLLPLGTTAPPTVEIALRTRDEQILIHCVNHASGKILAPNDPFIETVPPTPPFTVTLALPEAPARVRLEPGEVEPDWGYEDEAVTVSVPPVHLHTVIVIESQQ